MKENRSYKKRVKILLADDDDLFLHVTSNLLKGEGFEIHTARSGSEALKMIATIKPDLVILDSNMPNVSGEQVCRLIKASKEMQVIPVIILSGLEDEESIRRFVVSGCDDYFPKSQLVSDMNTLLKTKVSKALKSL